MISPCLAWRSRYYFRTLSNHNIIILFQIYNSLFAAVHKRNTRGVLMLANSGGARVLDQGGGVNSFQ